MKRIMVTGGAGFLGTNLTLSLTQNSKNFINIIDNLSTSSAINIKNIKSNNINFIENDICSPINVDDSLDEIYHLACPASPVQYQKNPLATLFTSFLGTKNVLEFALKHNCRVLFTSTSEVYGDPSITPQNEIYNGNVNILGPRSCYDEGKRAAETLCFEYKNKYNLDIRIVRLFNTYGPYMAVNDGRLISNIIIQALRGDDLTIFGNGKQTRSFCYVDDLIIGLKKAMSSDIFSNPINLGNPNEIQIIEAVEKIKDLTNSKSEIVFKHEAIDDPQQRRPDISKAEKYLGWKPKTKLEDGLLETINYFDSIL